MARNISISDDHSPAPTADPVLIEIPANEFSNAENSASSPPPARLLSRSGSKSSPENWEKRLLDAAAARNASLEQMRLRCRDHIDHVVSVVNGVKETRRQDSAARHEHLSSMQRDAAERRSRLLAKRKTDRADARVRRARILRQRSAEQKLADVESARNAREAAERRRGRILSEKKERAARFSPPRSVPSPQFDTTYQDQDHMTDGTPSSPSSMSVASYDDDTTTGSMSNESSPQSASSGRGRLPRSLARSYPRMQSLDSDDDMKETDSPSKSDSVDVARLAARKIAGYYLLSKARKALLEAGVLEQQLPSCSFEECTALLENIGAQNAADLVFQALGMRNTDRRMTHKDALREQAERRILLSCLIVALHPEAVMEEKIRTARPTHERVSADCAAVYAARRMLLCLHFGTLGAVAAAWVKWRRAFMRWKKNDAEVLLSAMIEDAVATEALRIAVDRKFIEAETEDGMRSTLGASSVAVSLRRQERAVWEEQLNLKQKKIKEAVCKLSGVRGERRLQAALSASRQIQDERLVHEIMIDLPGLLERIHSSSVLPADTWERLGTELSNTPPSRDELASRLVHIAKLLNSMIDGCFSIDTDRDSIELDAEFAVNLVCRVADALEKCQAEILDGPLREWVADSVVRLRSAGQGLVPVVVTVLREVTELVERVQHSVVAFRIRQAAPIVQQYGAAWERSHFQGHIVSGEFAQSFPRTKRLLREAFESVRDESRALEKDVAAGVPSACRTLLIHVILRLIFRSRACRFEDIPEFLHLDLERIVQLQNDIQRSAILASLDNIGKQFLRTKDTARSFESLKNVATAVERANPTMEGIQHSFVSSVSSILREVNAELTGSEKKLLEGMVEQTVKPGDPTFTVMTKRIETAVLKRSLRVGSWDERANMDSRDASEASLSPLGLEAVEKDIEKMSRIITALVGHLLQVHGQSLTSIMKSL